jgi:hypothetical protein
MKRRVRKIANFFAFNLLFFALYLNFIHKDKVAAIQVETTQTAAFSGTLVENQANPDKKNSVSASADQSNVVAPETSEPLRLSIN